MERMGRFFAWTVIAAAIIATLLALLAPLFNR
jgi:uncharacterized protein involved in outer membrane biogenesis